jgi:hypothetical protein
MTRWRRSTLRQLDTHLTSHPDALTSGTSDVPNTAGCEYRLSAS